MRNYKQEIQAIDDEFVDTLTGNSAATAGYGGVLTGGTTGFWLGAALGGPVGAVAGGIVGSGIGGAIGAIGGAIAGKNKAEKHLREIRK